MNSNKTTVDSKPLEMKSKPIEPPPTNDSPSSQESVCDCDIYKIISSESTCSSDSGKRKLSTEELKPEKYKQLKCYGLEYSKQKNIVANTVYQTQMFDKQTTPRIVIRAFF